MTLTIPLLFSLLLSLHTAIAFDITQLLNQYPEFATFNSYLTQTNLAAEINARNTITVLALDNGSLSPLAGKPVEQIRSILAVHVLLDYYDAPRLQTQAASRNLITTLFQATGLARGQQGFLSVSSPAVGTFAFGSAMPGSPLNSNLVKSIFLQPYNISILQVSSAIIPQGIDGTKTSSPPSTAPPATPVATATPPAATSLSPPTTPPQSTTPPPPGTSATLPTAPPQAQASSPPVPPMAPPTPTAATVPSMAPPTPGAATVPSMAPPTPGAATVPSMAPPTPGAAAVPSTAPPTPSKAAPLPSTSPPQTSTAPVQSAATPTSSKAPLPSNLPPVSATPASSPTAYAPGLATAPGAGPVTEVTEGGATPSGGKPAAKSAASPLDSSLAVVFTMVLSTLYLASTI